MPWTGLRPGQASVGVAARARGSQAVCFDSQETSPWDTCRRGTNGQWRHLEARQTPPRKAEAAASSILPPKQVGLA